MALHDRFAHPIEINGWVNGNLYIQSDEQLGIILIPDDVRRSCGMAEYNPNVDLKQPHCYLACMQGTRKAILPVHTSEEQALFRKLITTNNDFKFNSKSAHGSSRAACEWNKHADNEKNVFYKVQSHQFMLPLLLD